MNNGKLPTVVIIGFWLFLLPSNAFAYVDPGSGSIIVTTILGFFAAIAYTFRKYFYKLKRTIFGSKDKEEKSRSLDD